MKKLWNVAGDIMPDGLFIRTRKRWQCWKLRLFVRLFRSDICLKHAVVKEHHGSWGGTWSDCPICRQEEHEARAQAQLTWRENTKEILEALKHCKECK